MSVPPPIFATAPKEHVAFNPFRSSHGSVHASTSFNMDSPSQFGNMQSYNSCEPLDLPDLNAHVTPIKKRGRKANGTPGTDKYKKRKQRNRTHRKHHCTASEKREKKNRRKLHKQKNEIECNKEQIHKLKQKNQHLHKTQNLIESDLCAILDEYECQIGNDWTAIETEEQRYWDENDGFEQMRMNLKIMECACKTDIVHKQISDHLKRQCILDGKNTAHVPSSSTIRRCILYRLQLNAINVEELEQQHIQDIQKQKATKKKRKKKRKRAEMHQGTECSAFEIENGSSTTWKCGSI